MAAVLASHLNLMTPIYYTPIDAARSDLQHWLLACRRCYVYRIQEESVDSGARPFKQNYNKKNLPNLPHKALVQSSGQHISIYWIVPKPWILDLRRSQIKSNKLISSSCFCSYGD